MARPRSSTVTPVEKRILEVLWALGEASVADVTRRLSERKPVAYTTTLTMLGVLHRKKLVTYRRDGRAFIYRAKVSHNEVRERSLRALLAELFDGSPEALALHLVDRHGVDPKKLDELRKKIARAKAKEGGQS